jgi:hypothetical protein
MTDSAEHRRCAERVSYEYSKRCLFRPASLMDRTGYPVREGHDATVFASRV